MTWGRFCDHFFFADAKGQVVDITNISNGTKAEDLKRISNHYHLGLKIDMTGDRFLSYFAFFKSIFVSFFIIVLLIV